MVEKLRRNIVERYKGNPILTLRDLPFAANDIHNAGAVKHDGEYVLLVTVEELDGRCAIYRAAGTDGRRFAVDPTPVLAAAETGPTAQYETEGVRDARITPFGDAYYVTYLAQSQYGFRLGLARTQDLRTIERVGLISEPDTKSSVLFPCRFGGRYARLERPREGDNIWISYSRDLRYWGDYEVVMTPRHGYWDYHRIGVAVPPMRLPCGWLLFYYGEKLTPSGPLFRLGVAFLDLDEPALVVARSDIPTLAPRESYERIGDVGNLVFSCGAVLGDDASLVELYYGAADSCIALGTVSTESLRAVCESSG
jgi:beta-1,4-mannooligosaccharide/beta-1,4-mannosyl-N-acetylglucosamine phosphorylase